jgi:Flp pilus assembly pilin Flp
MTGVLALLFDEKAQDSTEYTLMLAFVVVVSAAIFMLNGGSVSVIWGITNNNLNAGITSAAS